MTPSELAALLRFQATASAGLGSPLYERLLAVAADDVERDGVCWSVLAPFVVDADPKALPLRFMAAVHRLVLRREAGELALHFPSVGGTVDLDEVGDVFLDEVAANVDRLGELTALPCQTNEVGRSSALGAAMAWLAGHHDLPLHLHEIGTSAGLNLRWDHFRYGTSDGSVTWGPTDSPVDLVGHWVQPPTGLPRTVEVATRRGCDPEPLDPTDQADRETLTASVWADMPERHERLKGALELAGAIPAQVDRVPAGDWLASVLPSRPESGITVVSHSVVWRYVPAEERTRIVALLEEHGRDATDVAPLVWLRLEPRPPAMVYDGNPYPILATTWPGGQTIELGTAQAHGQELHWSGPIPFDGADGVA